MNAHDVDVWAKGQMADLADSGKQSARHQQLLELRKNLRKSDPNRYPVGSPQHTLALFERKDALKKALSLGYVPPEEVALEVGMHAMELGLGI